jgi:hypothetical protein
VGSKYTYAYILAIVAVLGGGLFWYLQRPAAMPGPAPLTAEAKAYVHNLRLSDVQMKATESYVKQTITEIQGNITNAGDRTVDAVEIYCSFYDPYGQLVLRERVPIVKPGGGGLKPGAARSFRLPFDDIPASWNNRMPQLVIAHIAFS